MQVAILYNEPVLPREHPDYASEAGVLDSVRALTDALQAAGHAVAATGVREPASALWDALRAIQADVIVNLVEGFAGESRHEPHVAGCLELLGVPYTGSPPECLALVHDKVRTKQLLLGAGLPTAPFWRVAPGEDLPREALNAALEAGPLFVKPAAEDASLGIDVESVVHDWAAIKSRVEKLHRQYGLVLIERYLNGREFNVAVVALPELQVLPLAEIVFQRNQEHPWPIVTYDSKWAEGSLADRATPAVCPANVAPPLADRLRRIAAAAFRATGCRGYARVDVRTDSAGEPFILEVNANPDIGPAAGFARAIREFGWSYAQFAERLIATAASRFMQSPSESLRRSP